MRCARNVWGFVTDESTAVHTNDLHLKYLQHFGVILSASLLFNTVYAGNETYPSHHLLKTILAGRYISNQRAILVWDVYINTAMGRHILSTLRGNISSLIELPQPAFVVPVVMPQAGPSPNCTVLATVGFPTTLDWCAQNWLLARNRPIVSFWLCWR